MKNSESNASVKSNFFHSINTKYLNGKYRKIEFICCLILYIALIIVQQGNVVPEANKGVSGNVLSFFAVYFAFRFGYFGLAVATFLNIEQITGLLIKYSIAPRGNYLNGLTASTFSIISSVIVGILANKQEKHKRKLQWLADTDELTGIFNQRFFHISLEKEIENADKDNTSLGLILIDIDNFKMYNDIYGHDGGDKILKGTTNLLKSLLKDNQSIYRFGGDEFAIILPGATEKEIENTGHLIRQEFEKQKKDFFENDVSQKVTLSMGLSEYPNMAENKNELISQADLALYHAKNLGKDKVHFYQDVILQIRKNVSIDHQQLIGAFKGLLSTISAKDMYTLGHSERVSTYAVLMGEKMDLGVKDISILQYAGLLHDIGKIEIPKSILNKAGRLTDEEFALIRKHPVYSANILEPLGNMDQLIEIVKHHHERFDGRGYPDGISGVQISLGARILCVADSFDAMLSERPYSRGKSMEEAFVELEHCAGTQFDPEVVKIFLKIMKEEMIRNHYSMAANI